MFLGGSVKGRPLTLYVKTWWPVRATATKPSRIQMGIEPTSVAALPSGSRRPF